MTWESTQTYLRNGQYLTKIVFTKTGTYNDINFVFTKSDNSSSVSAMLKNLEKIDAPDLIRVTPGPCHRAYPDITSSLSTVIAGKKEHLTIQCRDKYNNMIYRGGDNFTSAIIGQNLSFVKTDIVQSTIRDMSDGTYTLEFVVAYQGEYQIELGLNHRKYGEPIIFNSKNQFCNDNAKPFHCPGTQNCVASAYDCGFKILNRTCPDATPFWCKVDGVQ
jgi:hypothetical protein